MDNGQVYPHHRIDTLHITDKCQNYVEDHLYSYNKLIPKLYYYKLKYIFTEYWNLLWRNHILINKIIVLYAAATWTASSGYIFWVH